MKVPFARVVLRTLILGGIPLAPAACAPPEAPRVIDDAALANEMEDQDWLAYGRTYSEQRFSPLDQINASNVADLGVDWYLDLPEDRGLVSTQPPSPPPLRPRPRGSAGPSCSLASTTCCHSSVPPAAPR
jgi:hypothetical protein